MKNGPVVDPSHLEEIIRADDVFIDDASDVDGFDPHPSEGFSQGRGQRTLQDDLDGVVFMVGLPGLGPIARLPGHASERGEIQTFDERHREFRRVRQRAMTHVVEHGRGAQCRLESFSVTRSIGERMILPFEGVLKRDASHMHGTKAMDEPIMGRARITIFGKPELFDVSKPLEKLRFDDHLFTWGDFYCSVDDVSDVHSLIYARFQV